MTNPRPWAVGGGGRRKHRRTRGTIQRAYRRATANRRRVMVYTLDPAELANVVVACLTRGFTQTECDRYAFGIDCPTLDQLVDIFKPIREEQ